MLSVSAGFLSLGICRSPVLLVIVFCINLVVPKILHMLVCHHSLTHGIVVILESRSARSTPTCSSKIDQSISLLVNCVPMYMDCAPETRAHPHRNVYQTHAGAGIRVMCQKRHYDRRFALPHNTARHRCRAKATKATYEQVWK